MNSKRRKDMRYRKNGEKVKSMAFRDTGKGRHWATWAVRFAPNVTCLPGHVPLLVHDFHSYWHVCCEKSWHLEKSWKVMNKRAARKIVTAWTQPEKNWRCTLSVFRCFCCFQPFPFLGIPGCRINWIYSVKNKTLLQSANCAYTGIPW